MKIQQVSRQELDESKYNDCIENAKFSKIFGFSWYLDAVVDQWMVLMINDYEAVMPIPYKKKYGITYVYPPFWILELGIYSKSKNDYSQDFMNYLKANFKWIELRLNENNDFILPNNSFIKKQFQVLNISKSYDAIFNAFRKDRKKDLKKAKSSNLEVKWDDELHQLITLFQNNIGLRTPNIKEDNYKQLSDLIKICIDKRKGTMLSVYQNETIVASAFLLFHKAAVTILVSSTDLKNRENGINTFLIDLIINKYQGRYKQLNFGGSSIDSIASYFLSFGAETVNYPMIKLNQLPIPIRWFKQ